MASRVDAGRRAGGIRVLDCSLALAMAALVAVPAGSAYAGKPAPTAVKAAKKPAKPKPAPSLQSDTATRVAEWVIANGDNSSLPYLVIDKRAAALFLYDAEGKPLGSAPVLIGMALGDEATPGVGSKTLAQLGPAEKTTPAGRFLAKYGKAFGHDRVLWVDYTNSVALHPVVTSNKKERRVARLASPTADDNRITFGCINVPPAFYARKIQPLFQKKGGIVYVLPDTKQLEDVFPLMRVWPLKSASL